MKKEGNELYWNTVLLGIPFTEGLNSSSFSFTAMKTIAKWIPILCCCFLPQKVQKDHSCCSTASLWERVG